MKFFLNSIYCAFFGLFFGIISSSSALANNADGQIIYDVKPGDTLIAIANNYMVKSVSYHNLQKLNAVQNPRHLPINKKIIIPRAWLKYQRVDAQIISLRGNVVRISQGTANNLAVGGILREGDIIRTNNASYTTLMLPDRTKLSIPSNSEIRISLLRQYNLGKYVDIDFDIIKGGAKTKVTPLKSKQDRYRIRTPRSVSAVRGTEFQMRAEDADASIVEVLEGGVSVDLNAVKNSDADMESSAENNADIAQNILQSGFGLKQFADGRKITENLLAAPNLNEASFLQKNEKLQFSAIPPSQWKGLRAEISADSGFTDIIYDGYFDKEEIITPSLEDGNYFIRLSAISDNKIEGIPGIYGFKRRLHSLSASGGKDAFGYKFKWAILGAGKMTQRLQIFKDSKNNIPFVDEAGLTSNEITISDLPKGEYFWRVGSNQFLDGEFSTSWTEFEKIVVN
ncbi:hypothetical protein LPB140_04825 [Sphingorhabdus lutea]|uniref:LysM domain-containing protein n=1 Tax=Sphingorhabdus lutea TaxID=1913578 RepID=A0A1L3JAS3_9SPHN|nr:FecR domain-containing protein [Sphingorhabdus lutea]APG62235.1 hypothetical protein LPB140_04825 [Sphingorhabdus lutea]